MKCPVDKSVMMVVEHHRIEIDYCIKCSGVWLDSGELDLLVSVLKAEGANVSPADVSPEKAEVTQSKRRCPICGRKMDKVWLGKGPRVLIDSCPAGDGLWFDRGELQKIIHGMETPEKPLPAGVLPFLGAAMKATHKHEVKKETGK
jgi:uncharacterized protein